MVYAMPAHPENRHSGRAVIPRKNTETDVDGASAGWERQWPPTQPPTAPFPERRERCAELADLQGSSRSRGDHDAGLGRVHPKQDSRRL
jgi:hypothetical protein